MRAPQRAAQPDWGAGSFNHGGGGGEGTQHRGSPAALGEPRPIRLCSAAPSSSLEVRCPAGGRGLISRDGVLAPEGSLSFSSAEFLTRSG